MERGGVEVAYAALGEGGGETEATLQRAAEVALRELLRVEGGKRKAKLTQINNLKKCLIGLSSYRGLCG